MLEGPCKYTDIPFGKLEKAYLGDLSPAEAEYRAAKANLNAAYSRYNAARDGYRLDQVSNLTGSLNLLSMSSFGANLPVYGELMAMRSQLIEGTIGATPRAAVLIRTIIGLSPGSVKVWFDTERLWMAEGRKTPEAHPVYHQITEAEAKELTSEHPDPDLAHRLMEPDEYIGE
jgi:hypothetical protein